jgi:lysyl-tRNA synthetase class 2
MSKELTELEIQRRDSLEKIKALGINPYPQELFEVNVSANDIHQHFTAGSTDYTNVSIAGRLMSKRIMGKASFAELQDSSGKIQLYMNRDEICPGEDKVLYNDVFKKYLDLGDFIGVTGYVFITQVGEVSIHVKTLKLLSKSLKPLPVVKTDADGNVHDAFANPELRWCGSASFYYASQCIGYSFVFANCK